MLSRLSNVSRTGISSTTENASVSAQNTPKHGKGLSPKKIVLSVLNSLNSLPKRFKRRASAEGVARTRSPQIDPEELSSTSSDKKRQDSAPAALYRSGAIVRRSPSQPQGTPTDEVNRHLPTSDPRPQNLPRPIVRPMHPPHVNQIGLSTPPTVPPRPAQYARQARPPLPPKPDRYLTGIELQSKKVEEAAKRGELLLQKPFKFEPNSTSDPSSATDSSHTVKHPQANSPIPGGHQSAPILRKTQNITTKASNSKASSTNETWKFSRRRLYTRRPVYQPTLNNTLLGTESPSLADMELPRELSSTLFNK